MTEEPDMSHQKAVGLPSDRAVAYDGSEASATGQIAWMKIFDTGVPELDAWHMQLIDDHDRLQRIVDRGAPWRRVIAAAERLVACCIDHFRFEECLMVQIAFPRRDMHIEEHRRIERQLTATVARIRDVDGSQVEHRSIPASFRPILIDLMVRHDLDYRSHLHHWFGR